MRTTTMVGWAALGSVALLGAASLGGTPAGFWAPEGFRARADTLIRRGHLELRCSDQDSIVVSFPQGSPEEAFFASSYLRSDVRSFNSGPDATRSPFLVDGCRLVGVDPFYHRVDLPYNRLPRWRGDVLFTFDGRTATLEGAASQELEVRHPLDGVDAAGSSERVSPDRQGARVRTPLLRLTAPAGREVLADAFFVGDDPVLADRRDVGSSAVLRVNGFRTPPGRMLRLEPGDWLQVAGGDGVGPAASTWTYVAETRDRARTASFVRVRNDRVERLFPASRLRPVLEPFGRAMDLALQTVPDGVGSGVVEADVRLTLDRELTDALDGVLSEWCRERAHPLRPRAASLLVMDGFTGKVRAVPSCPGPSELAAWEPLSARTRERFLRNQNLVPHPVGSAAKPFWTAAVATTWPNMLDLEIPAHAPGPVGSVLGCPVDAPYGDGHGAAAWTGLEAFMQRSCNRYLVEMASAGLALGAGPATERCRTAVGAAEFARCLPPGPPPEPSGSETADRTGVLRFCDAVVSTTLAPGLQVVGDGCDDLQLVDAGFAPGPVLAGMSNVSVYRDPAPDLRRGPGGSALGDRYRLGRYRVDAWRTVLDELAAAGDTADLVRTALRFSGVSPQAANLALNTVEELRTDWVNLLLGGENSRWSNFELAEATARLVTGRAVRGSLADRVTLPGGDPAPEADPAPLLDDRVLRAGVRRRVLHAMELVARPGGTAGGLAPALERVRARLRDVGDASPWELYAFAKTGTPAVEVFVPGDRREARQGAVLVLSLLAVPAERGRGRAAGMDAWVSACPLDPGLRRGILEVPPGDLLDPDRAVALSVAIYLDDLDPDEGSGSAVELALRTVDDLGDYLLREVRRRVEEAG